MPGIGGRRWAKFSKYFSRLSVDFRVIAAKNQSENQSVWVSDIDSFKSRIDYLDSNYPQVLGSYPNSIKDKIRYRFSVQKAKAKTQGNYYDKSIYWIKSIEKIVEINYNKGYKNLIISGAPFYQMQIVRLKKKLPQLKVFLDFRDPWVNNKTAFGFEDISSKRQAFEIQLEKSVVSSADAVVSVAQQMTDYFTSIGATKSICIPNGFDPDDYKDLKQNRQQVEPLKCIFAGTLYKQVDSSLLLEFLNAIEFLNKNYSDKIRFQFIGNVPFWFAKKASEIKGISISPGTSKEIALQAINEADYGMLFLTEDINYSVSSKMLDYIALNKPILCFSKTKSITGKIIEEKGIGHGIELNSIQVKLVKILSTQLSVNQEEMDKYQNDYNLNNLASSWISLIQARD